jgi:hypothetical protein
MGTATPGSTGNLLPIRSQHACSRSRWGAIEESDSIPCEGGASGTGRAAASTDCTSASTARIAASSCGRVASCQPCSTKPEAARRGFSQVCVTLSLPKGAYSAPDARATYSRHTSLSLNSPASAAVRRLMRAKAPPSHHDSTGPPGGMLMRVPEGSCRPLRASTRSTKTYMVAI